MPPATVFVRVVGLGLDGRLHEAGVSRSGAVFFSPPRVDTGKFQAMNAADTAFTFFDPTVHQVFVVTGIEVKATRSVSTTVDARIVIYEASAATSTTEDRVIYETALVRGEKSGPPGGVRFGVTEGKWINGKTSDPTVNANVFGHFIQA